MSRKEHDRPDPALIVEGSRRHQRSKRIQGLDYPITPLEELKRREQEHGGLGGLEAGNSLGLTAHQDGDITATRDVDRTPRPTALADSNMPIGEACNADGTLKDASEIEWFDSPSGKPIGLPPVEEPILLENEGSDIEIVGGKRKRPSHASKSKVVVSSDEEEDREVRAPVNKLKKPKVSIPDGGEEETGDVTGSHAVIRPDKDAATKDLRLCLKDGTRFSKEKKSDVKGAYCKFCLESKKTKDESWLTGNVTSKRRHLFRWHLDEYYKICQKNSVDPKPPAGWTPPIGWKPPGSANTSNGTPGLTQQSLNDFTVKAVRPMAVTKLGIQEHLLALIATCDLPFRFCERKALRRFVLYLNPKLTDSDIPKKSALADSVNKKLVAVDELTCKLIEEIPSKISVVWDGWTTKNRRPYTSVSISFIHSPPNDDTLWTLKNMLIEFNSPIGRHTGEMIGKDLLTTLRKYGVDSKLGWLVGDGVSSNDVAVRYVCNAIDPTGKDLNPKDVRIRCIDHSMHRGAYHFIKALGIPSLMRTKKAISNENDDEDDVDMSPDIEASSDDVDAMLQATIVDFDAGDVIGKLLTFVNQVRMSSEGVRDYLKHACTLNQVKEILLRLWVRTRWGSLSDCFGSTLTIQKGIDYFCLTADSNEELPALTKGKAWSDYRLTSTEWKLVKLVHHCLKLIADRHNELSVEDSPTCSKVYPLLELLLSDWEDLLEDKEYAPVHDALRAGIACLEKYYKKADDTSAYFISHVLDPARKLDYLNAAWEQEYIDKGMAKMRKVFLRYKNKSSSSNMASQASDTSSTPQVSVTDAWMDRLIKKNKSKGRLVEETDDSEDPYAELNRWFETKALPRSFCPNPIAWWGHQAMEYPILRQMARDYLAIPGTSCIAERSFSLSGRTDDPRRRRMDGVKFGTLQKLRAAYNDGRLDADLEAIRKYAGDFTFEDNDDD